MTTDRIIFANTLRGLSAVLVVVSHYAGIFWTMHPDIAEEMGVPPLANFPTPSGVLTVLIDNSTLLGQLGVGLFFIISGLVIPFSFVNNTKKSFLAKRILRIYPVYIAGFSIVMLALYSLSAYVGVGFRFSVGDMLAHLGVITRAPLGVTRIDGISWTLEVEIYFYLAMCLVGPRLLAFDIKRYIAASLLIAVLSAVTFKTQGNLNGAQVACAMLLLLGLAYHALLAQRLSMKAFWLLQGVVCTLIAILWLGFANRTSHTIAWMSAYLLAILVFHGCFVCRHRFRDNRILAHLSAISYPLYVVHAVAGYVILYLLLKSGVGIYPAIAVAMVAAYLAALLIHVMIEKPALRWAKRDRQRAALG